MKKITLGLSLLICAFADAQTTTPNWLEEVIVEKYYISTADDSINSTGILPVGSVTYRVFADILPGYQFTNIYGEPGHELRIATTTKFFNNEDRGDISPIYTKTQAKGNTIMLDSWLSGGPACKDNWGVMKTEDDGVANVVNADGILKNENVAVMGIPLTQQDGMIAKKANEKILDVTLSPGLDLGIFGSVSQQGGLFSSESASVSTLGGQVGPTGTNRVLVGQFTTNGVFSFKLNFILQDSIGNSQRFVAEKPVDGTGEINIPSLIYPFPVQTSNVAPTVAITAPVQYSKYKTTDVVTIKANAADADGKVVYVKFYVDNGAPITDSVAPYEYDYTPAGNSGKALKLGAIAMDDKGTQTMAEQVIVFVEGNNSMPNIMPYAKLTSPANGSVHKKNSDIIIKADAMDVDGTIKRVDFLVGSDVITDSVAPYEVTWKPLVVNDTTITIFARAVDNYDIGMTGGFNSYDTEKIKLMITDNNAPAINITAPADGAKINENQETTITTNATDDSKVDLVEFYINGVKIGEDGSAPYELKWKAVLGNATITAVATDNKGVKTTSSLIKVIVEKPNSIATVNAVTPSFKVYPNPTSSSVFIEFTGGKKNSYTIYDIKGAVVVQKQINSSMSNIIEKIDISELLNGQYMLQLIIDNVKSAQKIIKN